MTYQKILLAYSDPQNDKAVMQAALDVAHHYDTELTVLHINVRQLTVVGRTFRSYQRHYSEEEIRGQIDALNVNNIAVEIRITHGEPSYVVDDIVKASRDFDLLVMGHEHMNLFEELVTDSTDERVINKICTHTLVVPIATLNTV